MRRQPSALESPSAAAAFEAKLILIGLDRGVDIVDHDADVVHTLKHKYLLVISALFLTRLI